MGVLRETEDEIPVIVLGWFLAFAGVFAIEVAWGSPNGYDLAILLAGALAAGVGLWLLVKAFLHYRLTGLVTYAKFWWFVVKAEAN